MSSARVCLVGVVSGQVPALGSHIEIGEGVIVGAVLETVITKVAVDTLAWVVDVFNVEIVDVVVPD
jgi:hypothetical protein